MCTYHKPYNTIFTRPVPSKTQESIILLLRSRLECTYIMVGIMPGKSLPPEANLQIDSNFLAGTADLWISSLKFDPTKTYELYTCALPSVTFLRSKRFRRFFRPFEAFFAFWRRSPQFSRVQKSEKCFKPAESPILRKRLLRRLPFLATFFDHFLSR